MSFSVNKVALLGILGKDPETRTIANGTEVSNFSVATEESWKDKESDDWKKKTEWHAVTIWGMPKLVNMLRKGSKVFIEGKLNTRKWQDQSGADRYTTSVVVQAGGGVLIPLDKNNGRSENYDQSSPSSTQKREPVKPKQAATLREEMDDSEIPF